MLNKLPALVLLLLALPLATACSSDQKQIARFTAENAYAVLSLAQKAEAAQLYSKHCTAYECASELDCAAATECPALTQQFERWKPVWKAHDLFKAAVEAGNTDEAARLYCELVALAPAPLPRGEGCP